MVTYTKADIDAAYISGMDKGKKETIKRITEKILKREQRVRSFDTVSQLNAYVKGVQVCQREILGIIEKESNRI